MSIGPRGQGFAQIAGPHPPVFASPGCPVRKPLHLLVLWEADAAYTLRHLSLVCPKLGALTRESVAAYWTIEIPHPNVWRPTSAAAMPEAPVEARDDLDIRVRRGVEASREAPT
jgi:hypothetical protein